MNDEMRTGAADLLRILDKDDRNTWKYPELWDVCHLALEYMTLDGLEDARRGADIEYLLTIGTPEERAKEA